MQHNLMFSFCSLVFFSVWPVQSVTCGFIGSDPCLSGLEINIFSWTIRLRVLRLNCTEQSNEHAKPECPSKKSVSSCQQYASGFLSFQIHSTVAATRQMNHPKWLCCQERKLVCLNWESSKCRSFVRNVRAKTPPVIQLPSLCKQYIPVNISPSSYICKTFCCYSRRPAIFFSWFSNIENFSKEKELSTC